jgi:nucleoside transporter
MWRFELKRGCLIDRWFSGCTTEQDHRAPKQIGPAMNTSVRNRLSVMMFLEFFIWGVWLPKIFAYLGDMHFRSWEQSLILNAFAVASFAAIFFSTHYADRHFAAEKFLAFSQLIGGLAMLGLFWVPPANPDLPAGQSSFWMFFTLMLVHSLFYVPTISITNAIAFAHLTDPQKQFGSVRLWGAIGWIVAGWPFVFILTDWAGVPGYGTVPLREWLGKVFGSPLVGEKLVEGTRYTFVASAIASLLLAAFSLTLPHTPPKPAGLHGGVEKLAWLEAMKLLRLPFILVLFVVTFFDAAIHQCYFTWTDKYLQSVGIPANWTMPAMSISQIVEVPTLAVLGYCLKRMGWKTTMIVGILGHMVRFGVFALAPVAWMAVSVNVVHGVCYAFFFATVYLFVDEFFPKDVRSSAQGLFNFLILGLGPFVGNFIWPMLGDDVFKVDGIVDYRSLFLVPASTALFAALLLALFFYPPKKADSKKESSMFVEDEAPIT